MTRGFSGGFKLFLGLTCTGGLIVLFFSTLQFKPNFLWPSLVFFLVSYIADVLTVKLPNLNVYLSVASHLNFAALFLFGPFAAFIPALAGALPYGLPLKRWYVYFFNGAQLAISYGAAALVFSWAGGLPFWEEAPQVGSVLLPILAAGAAYFLLNVSLMAGVIAIDQKENFAKVFLQLTRWEAPNLLITLPFALFMAYLFVNLSYWGLLILILPLFASRYIFQAYVEIKNTYTDTVRSLMATVDKKFGQTGGSQKVSEYATQTALRLGFREEDAQILGYAAYLRHIGLLSIPKDTIEKGLSQLSFRELRVIDDALRAGSKVVEKMEFLRKAAPYIRYHHEKWDGSGPEGLKGEEIPLGARIIAVSEYLEAQEAFNRGGLEEALNRLRTKSGRDFDPAVVDTLNACLKEKASL